MTESVTGTMRFVVHSGPGARGSAEAGHTAVNSSRHVPDPGCPAGAIRHDRRDGADALPMAQHQGWRHGATSPRLLAVRGASGSGKTTLIEAMIPRLVEVGVRVGTIKHAHHGAALDVPGKDSHRHAMAGAACVLLLAPGQAGFFVPREAEPDPAAWLEYFADRVDLILVEGYGRAPIPSITIEVSDVARPDLEESSGKHGPRWTFRGPRHGPAASGTYARMVECLVGRIVARLDPP